MSVSKSLDTDFLNSEKKTLFRFAVLYFLLTLVIVSVFSFMYYDAQKNLMLQEKKPLLQEYSKELIQELKKLHRDFDKRQTYPRSQQYDSAIYDNERKLIFSTSSIELDVHKILYLEKKMIHLVNIPESYYLGAKYIIIQIKDDGIWLEQTKKTIILFVSLAFVFMMGVGYILLRLFLKPMRDAIELLDRFIKDTTHELNTPVSTIVTNIEMIDKSVLDSKLLKKINRIDIGAKTISNIYQDLTYLTLGNKIISNDELVDIKNLAMERIDYFNSLASAKKVSLDLEIKENTSLFIDKAKISKLLDNLISNAIKYNKINGFITILVDQKCFTVKDTGIGISQDDIAQLQERYIRFNTSTGGFGIGLNIVSSIAQEYDLSINIESELDIGTKVSVRW